MPINRTQDLPVVTQLGKQQNERLKFHVLSQLGHPVVNVEITEAQLEQILRSAGDYMARYFPLEEKYSFFWTNPMQSEYDIPDDGYWISEVFWDPNTSSISDIFSIDYITFNAANITGYQNLLMDYHMIRSYQQFASRVLGIEGGWEYKLADNKIKLYPVPKGTFPVVVRYVPILNAFKSPQARECFYDAILAKMKIALGHARRKMENVPSPDGGTLGFDGAALVQEGEDGYDKAIQKAINDGEPLRPYFM